ncbi:hypothetical protein T03_17861 [Trichinella britovi]|uniref:Uncharacterized protein n=1 Tax=Trichinella britovi TaxID=45882 RepID=A0A0V1D2Y0_TRIBR|nr:hypothetical protein T03_17861 [Trichinella britovi]
MSLTLSPTLCHASSTSRFPRFHFSDAGSSDLHGSQLLITCRTCCLDTVRSVCLAKHSVRFIPGWSTA